MRALDEMATLVGEYEGRSRRKVAENSTSLNSARKNSLWSKGTMQRRIRC